MSTFMVISVTPRDTDAFARYEAGARAIAERHGATLLARQDDPLVLETIDRPATGVILEFPDRASMLAYWNDPDYQPLKAFRHGIADAQAIVIDG